MTTRVDVDAETGVVRASFDPSTESPSEVVTAVVAAIENVDVASLDPLHDAVDPEALDDLLTSAQREASGAGHTVSFDYAGYRVAVDSDGTVVLRPTDEEKDA